MTATLEQPLVEPTPDDAGSPPPPPTAEPDLSGRPLGIGLTCAGAAVATLAAGWMLGGVFAGPLPRIAAMLAAMCGPAAVLLSYRFARPALIQYLALPAALLSGALFVLPSTTGGSANLPSLVVEAIKSGGLGQPPVPFEPGWRFLIVVLLALLGTGAASLGVSADRPRLAVLIPLPVVIGAALVQPTAHAAFNSVIAIVLMVGALILSSGAQLVQEGASSTRFEARRLMRGAGALAVLAAILVPLSQAGFLFPAASDDRVIPPMRPKPQPPLSDRVLYTVTAAKGDQGPWRFGVEDSFNGEAWLLPPYDVRRFVDVGGDGDLRAALKGHPLDPADGPASIPAAGGQTREVTFTVGDLPGRVLPIIEGARAITNRDLTLQFDPRTQTLRAPNGRPPKGTSYTVRGAALPDAATLAAAPAANADELKTYLQVPTAPQGVLDLLAKAPKDNKFRRLQYVRTELYKKVVAAGKGEPVDISPERVVEMLGGAKATPFEITAAEALLARWAGVPSRIGYGFYSGTRNKADTGYEIHPRDGATWLEAYFPGPGWVSIVGRPPRAQASTSQDQKNRDQSIRATEDLALIVHVPVALDSLHQFYEDARYWIVVSLPWVLLVVLVGVFYPAALKQVRRVRRLRWARRAGPSERILASYADFRDRMRDLNAPHPNATPLEFVRSLAYDDEHWELAWLVTRALYGDLRRDVRPEDARAAEAMARSVTRRTTRGQRLVVRMLGQANRGSLRDPYTTELPNFWPSGARVRRLRVAVRRFARAVVRGLNPLRVVRGIRRARPAAANSVLVLAALLSLTSCGSGRPAPPPPLPQSLVPVAVGDYIFQREPEAERVFTEAGSKSLVRDGRVFTVRRGKEVLGSVQAAQFLPAAANDRRRTQTALRKSLGSGHFERRRLGSQIVDVLVSGESKILLYFPPGGGYYEMLDARAGFTDADRVFLAILDYQSGNRSTLTEVELTDPRRGGD
jgi:hypothetical protein